jgi:hypothetical protein
MSKVKIFVSYAHADLEPYPGYQLSRVGTILDEIKHHLGCHDRRCNFEILRDRDGLISPSYNIDEMVDRGIEDCDIGLILMSLSYCNSEECELELGKLLDRGKPLFIVETHSIWDTQFENRLRKFFPRIERTLRIQFYGGPPEKRVLFGSPLPWLVDVEGRRNYDGALQQVVSGIQTRGSEFLHTRNAAKGMPAQHIGHHTVFLARSTVDVRNDAQRLATFLEKEGHSTFSFDPGLHVGPGTLTSSVLKTAIAKCDVVIQLLGGVPGAQIEGKTLVSLQHALGKESGKPHLVWRSPTFDPAECGFDYSDFLRSIQYHETSYEEFEQYALKQVANVMRLAESDARRKSILEANGMTDDDDILPLVAIDVAEPDVEIADVMAEALKQFAYVAPLPFDLDRTKLVEAISDNDGIILVYGESREGQMRIGAHFPIIHKSQRLSRKFDIAIGNGSGPRALPYPRGPNVHVIKVDRERMQTDAKSLNGFLDVVRANAARRLS